MDMNRLNSATMRLQIAEGMINLSKGASARAYWRHVADDLRRELDALYPIPDDIKAMSDDDLLRELSE